MYRVIRGMFFSGGVGILGAPKKVSQTLKSLRLKTAPPLLRGMPFQHFCTKVSGF